jgi:hypothetical protein
MHMSKHAAKLLSALAVALVTGTALAPDAVRAAPAETAAECLAAPNGPTPKGGHWKYRLDRATKQKCWYVKNVGTQPALAAAEPAEVEPDREPQVLQPSVAEARAELPPRQQPALLQPAPMQPAPAPLTQAAPLPSFQPPAPIAPQTNAQPATAPATPAQTGAVPSKDTARWSQASSWAESATTGSATGEPAAAKPTAAPVAPAAEASMFERAGIDSSLWMMLGALAGALALVGLAVGAAIRLSRPAPLERDRFIDAPLPWDAEVEDRPQPVFGTRRG